MLLPRFVRLPCLTCLLLGVIHDGAAAPFPPAKNKVPADFKRLAKVFGRPGSASVIGKTWVAVDTGPENVSLDLHGWLIEDGVKGLLLLDWYGELHKLRKSASDEKRPKIKEGEDGTFLFSTFQEADFSVAWKVRAEDYAAKSKKFLTDGLPTDKDTNSASASASQRFGLADHVVDAARYAHFAYQFGEKAHAADLYAHACKAQKKYADTYIFGFDKPVSLHVFAANRIASGYRNGAKAMAEHYKNLIKEDARPTRCKGHWRSYWPEHHYLLRYGDCCQQIFESITGYTIFRGTSTVSYPIHDKEQKQCKEKARKWWKEHQEKAPTTGHP